MKFVWCEAVGTGNDVPLFAGSIHETSRRQSVWWVITNNNYYVQSAAKRENWAIGGARGRNATLQCRNESAASLLLYDRGIYNCLNYKFWDAYIIRITKLFPFYIFIQNIIFSLALVGDTITFVAETKNSLVSRNNCIFYRCKDIVLYYRYSNDKFCYIEEECDNWSWLTRYMFCN